MELVFILRIVLLVLSTTWCFLQLCGVAIDVGTCLAEVLPLSVDQALSLTPVSRRRSLDPADHALLVQRSALFLHGLYRPHSSSRAKIVYVCALAMTFLFQPETRDNRMVLEFQRRIGELSPLLGLHNIVGDSDLQQLVMDYFRMVYHHDLCYHTRFSVLSSYATWFNEGRTYFIEPCCIGRQNRESCVIAKVMMIDHAKVIHHQLLRITITNNFMKTQEWTDFTNAALEFMNHAVITWLWLE
jgi:hypothetical protein